MPIPEFAAYPTFEPAFLSGELPVGPYLLLLNMSSPEADVLALRVVQSAIDSSPHIKQEIIALLAEANWRPQLVGAVALYLTGAETETIAALWAAFDSLSWASPQLAGVLRLTDPDFETAARARIAAGCPANMDRWEQYQQEGTPPKESRRDTKALTALVTLCRPEPDWQSWLQPLVTRDDIHQLLEDGYGQVGSFALDWLRLFQKRLEFL
jgi:hypothetical protein